MGISPECWGPYMWGAIHLISLGAPDQIDSATKNAYSMFFQQLPYILPCASCARHLQENLANSPVESHLQGKETLFAWSVQLHNTVNRQLGKSEMTLDKAREHWEGVCRGLDKQQPNTSMNVATNKKTILLFLVGVFIGIGFAYAVPRIRKGLRRN